MTVGRRVLAGHEALVCGTGYTGEDGVELLVEPERAAGIWDELLRRGARPAGLGARDTLRLEVCYPLYGNELSLERGPIEAGLGWCAKEDTGFIGAEAVRRVRAAGPSERLVPFKLTGPGVPRPGCPVVGGGEVTSGTYSPSLEIGVGMAYVSPERAASGTSIAIDVRGRERPAVVAAKPLFSHD
jgi:aminomethyltransferase